MKNSSLCKALFVIATYIFAAYSLQSTALGQTCGCSGSPATQGSGWQQGATVSVFIDPAITGDARTATQQAFNNWNTANQSNGSNVNYVFTNTRPTSGVGNYLIVNYASAPLIDPATGDRVRALTTHTSSTTTGFTQNG
jgi:hypothetical protein